MNRQKFNKPLSIIPISKTFNGKKYQQMGIYPRKEEMLRDLKRWANKWNMMVEIENCEFEDKVRAWNRPK